MKHLIRDASQVVIAVLITTSMVIVNAQTPKQPIHTIKPVVKVALAKPATPPAPVQPPATPEPAPAVETPAPAPVQAPEPVYPSTHEGLMAAAGISASDYAAVDYIVSHESGWDPNATEPHTGAHGLPQALPYSKTGCGWVDAICQLQWASSYATQRYGGWWPAYNYWVNNHNW